MAATINFNLKPVLFNPIVDNASDTTYILEVRDHKDEVVDLTGYTARMQLRPYAGSSVVYDTLTTENNRLITGTNGVTVKFPAVETKNYTFPKAVYDLYVKKDASQWRIAQGAIEFNKEVTL